MRTAPARIVDWVRVDPWPRMRRALTAGPIVMLSGGLAIAVSFLTHQPHDVRVASAAAGFVLIAGSAIYTVATMHAILRQDTYVAIRTDGVALRGCTASHVEIVLSWDGLESVRWDAAREEIILERVEGDAVHVVGTFARVTGEALARRIEQARRQAAMGLLR